jgi:amidase
MESSASAAPHAFASLTEQVALIASGAVSAVDLVSASLARIQRLDPELNAFVTVLADRALDEAASRDALAASGASLGPLHGVPIVIKDENDVEGTRTTFGGSAVTRIAERDAELVRRLRAAGAVIVGKTTMPEFGLWPFTESLANGITRNPWDRMRSTAGSSGGTAAAVASGMVAMGIGGDGGGSIRLPASWCGLYGLKPQRGRVSAAPHAALWRALGTAGPLTRTVADSALVYDVIAGTVDVDRYRADPWPRTLTETLVADVPRLRILVVEANPGGGPAADADTVSALHASAEALRALGHDVREGRLPRVGFSLDFMSLVAAGVADEAATLDRPDLVETRNRAGIRVSSMLAARAGAAERAAVGPIAAKVNTVFDDVDLVLMPTTPTPAQPIGRLDGLGFVRASLRATGVASFTSIWNVTGNPAAAIPAGFTSSGLPLSVQLVGRQHDEPTIVAVSAQLERVRPWADRRPPIA